MKRGKGYAVNVPLRDGITDEAFHSIFKPVRLCPSAQLLFEGRK